MQEQHLRPVPPVADDGEGTGQGAGAGRPAGPSKAKARPKKALPTDRMKLEAQKRALSTLAILSDGKEGVSGADMAPRLELAPSTAVLNNSFFQESGLIEKTGKGRYKSTEAANQFARRFSFDEEKAGLALRQPLSETWYFKTVRQQLSGFGPTAKEKLIELLAYEAETTKDYRVQLGALLSWLEYAGLIEEEGGQYRLSADAPETAQKEEDEPTGSEPEKPEPAPEGATKPPVDSGQAQQPPAETILGFSFDFALTGEELAKLSPEQITALFKAVGEVMALKAEATK